MDNEQIIKGKNVSEVWARAYYYVHTSIGHEASPLIICIEPESPESPEEDMNIRKQLDGALLEVSKITKKPPLSVETVANTIFPKNLWNPHLGREMLYERYRRIWPMISKCKRNNLGVYFQRMIAYESHNGAAPMNQLEHIIHAYGKNVHRRSALQINIFNPGTDHSIKPYLSFPCLANVAFVPKGDALTVSGYYPVQSIFERGYGNYLGLIHLGHFVASEMGLRLTKVICNANVALRGNERRKEVTPIYNRLHRFTEQYTQA